MSYTESDEYQQEISAQYKQRTASFERAEVVKVMSQIGLDIKEEDVSLAETGNMNATFLTDEYVVKINKENGQHYLANTIVSEQLSGLPVVNVLKYDNRDKTEYEVLVMKRTEGTLWQRTIVDQGQKTVEAIFRQIVEVVDKASALQSKCFGDIANADRFSYADVLGGELNEYVRIIKEKKLANTEDIDRCEAYVKRHLPILQHETAVLVHGDLHMGNVLHLGDTLTAVIDWDGASYQPKFVALVSLLGLIDKPSQYVEGTPDYPSFKDVRFPYLLPILRSGLPDVFANANLVHKLNLVGVVSGLSWVSGDWSKEWNKEMMKNLVEKETPDDVAGLQDSYFGKLLR